MNRIDIGSLSGDLNLIFILYDLEKSELLQISGKIILPPVTTVANELVILLITPPAIGNSPKACPIFAVLSLTALFNVSYKLPTPAEPIKKDNSFAVSDRELTF